MNAIHLFLEPFDANEVIEDQSDGTVWFTLPRHSLAWMDPFGYLQGSDGDNRNQRVLNKRLIHLLGGTRNCDPSLLVGWSWPARMCLNGAVGTDNYMFKFEQFEGTDFAFIFEDAF